MGDRANVIVLLGNSDFPVNLYSHFGGDRFHEAAASALATEYVRERIGDPDYFAARLAQTIGPDAVGTCLCPDNDNPRIMLIDAITAEVSYIADEFPVQQRLTSREWRDRLAFAGKRVAAQ